ncbi:MAG: phospholipase A [Deltaproteobacteria bacterium]|nr:MAG: phospholipase A [Deltaproteobacteria bacterium]
MSPWKQMHNEPLPEALPRSSSRSVHFSVLIFIFMVTILSNANLAGPARADSADEMSECAHIEDHAERLQCYDELVGYKKKEEVVTEPQAVDVASHKPEPLSYLSKLWDLDKESRREKYAITTHRANYILPLTYVDSPNEEAIREASPDKELKNAEIKLQLSFKVQLWEDIFNKNMDLWFGYTQLSFWQFYNFEDSSPFRETNYEPELLLNFRTSYDLLGLKGRFINVGINHQSNGRSEPLSRSWNRVVANFGLERDNLALILNTWLRIPESEDEDDNPDIEDYMGYGHVWLYYLWKDHRFGFMYRNNLHFDENRSTVQVEWSFPLIEHVSGYIQYFYGYGESLLDYNARMSRIGLGFIVKDW